MKPALATAAPLAKITETQIEFACPKNLFATGKNILEEILGEEDTRFRIFLLSQCFQKCECPFLLIRNQFCRGQALLHKHRPAPPRLLYLFRR